MGPAMLGTPTALKSLDYILDGEQEKEDGGTARDGLAVFDRAFLCLRGSTEVQTDIIAKAEAGNVVRVADLWSRYNRLLMEKGLAAAN